MPTYPQDPERAHKTWCSCTVLWPRPSETSVFHAHAPGRGSLWNATANPRAAARLVYYRHREKPPRVPLPSALLPWPPCGTCPSTPSQKLNWTRWRLYVTGLGLQLRATDPGGVRVNYKTVSPWYSLSTSLHSEQLNCSQSDLQPRKIRLQSPELLQRITKPPHFFLSSPAPCELFLAVWASGDCTEG